MNPPADSLTRSPETPAPARPVYFLADAHLGGLDGPADASGERDLEAFLRSLIGAADALYLVGDIFDFWFEFRVPSNHGHDGVLRALDGLSDSGTTVTFLGGNHDYWAGSEFKSLTGASVHHDPIVVTHEGRRVFIAHGDGLPAGDWGYRILKSVLRNPIAISMFRLLSPAVGASLAVRVSNVSGITDDRVQRAIPPMRDFLMSKLDEGLDAAIVGHVHAPRLWERNGQAAIIVGDWMTNRSVTALDASGFRMLRWTDGALVPNAEARQKSDAPG